MSTASRLYVCDWKSVLGLTSDTVNAGNVPPHPGEFSESWESGVEKQGQGDSCQTPVHTIWIESDTRQLRLLLSLSGLIWSVLTFTLL